MNQIGDDGQIVFRDSATEGASGGDAANGLPPQALSGVPPLAASLAVLAMMALVAVSCWMLYGEDIRLLGRLLWNFIFGK